jgi:hypothetical protein
MKLQASRRLMIPITALLLATSWATAQDSQKSASPAFTGNSKTTPVLRRDILLRLIPMFAVPQHCDQVETIDATFQQLDKDASGRVAGMLERWRATGCGKSSLFEVRLTRTSNDQTDFLVTPVQSTP